MALEVQQFRERELTGKITVGPELGFRPNTELSTYPVNFVMNEGGMGDLVNYAAATRWVAKNCPWIQGKLFVYNYLVPLFKDLHAEFSHWEVFASEKAEEHLVEGATIIGPGLNFNGRIVNPQLLTCLGAHPFDIGYAYFANLNPPPENAVLPVLDYPRERLLPKIKQIKGKYCVITVGATTDARTTRGKHINPLIDYAISKGITPVFLGKADYVGKGHSEAAFSDDVHYDLGVDLRNQTAVKDAACILQHAEFVLGLDNGLLHLASLMKDSKVIFGYNITTVEHRVPRRDHGMTLNLSVPQSVLPCIGCQSRWRQLHTVKFDKCFYDTKPICVDLLFWNDGLIWKKAIDHILEESK